MENIKIENNYQEEIENRTFILNKKQLKEARCMVI